MITRTVPPAEDSAQALRQLDELQGEVDDLRARIEQLLEEPFDQRHPERHRTQAPYVPERRREPR
jgi:hypothetical protein